MRWTPTDLFCRFAARCLPCIEPLHVGFLVHSTPRVRDAATRSEEIQRWCSFWLDIFVGFGALSQSQSHTWGHP